MNKSFEYSLSHGWRYDRYLVDLIDFAGTCVVFFSGLMKQLHFNLLPMSCFRSVLRKHFLLIGVVEEEAWSHDCSNSFSLMAHMASVLPRCEHDHIYSARTARFSYPLDTCSVS